MPPIITHALTLLGDPQLPAYEETDRLAKIWDNSPVYAKDERPPYPPLKNDDGSDIEINNLRSTRLYGWEGCNTNQYNRLVDGWKSFGDLASQDRLKSDIDWNSRAVSDFFGGSRNDISDGTRKRIQDRYYYASQMWSHWWDDISPPTWTDSVGSS